ncbi:MAG: nitrite/sulfite reductase [Verrucomicrobia bacterium]|nr:nitrite/sulfite reductase [Verrucomicrobiota bacterium]
MSWKEMLADRMPPDWAREIDVFEAQMLLRRDGKLDEKIFAESRLRRGVYGQRYDNGHRHDGIQSQTLDFPSGSLTKGPETMWDAPGMVRIKIPYGGVTPEQMDVLADLAEEYSDGILHVTTRQDFQLHFVHIEDTPDLMRRLASVGITTREACGNSVRNVTACPIAGVCRDEPFDVTPYASATMKFLLGHPDVQDFGRKFKIAYSGCRQHACGLVTMHDMGAIAVKKVVGEVEKRGFALYVGGGLGAVPHQAKVLEEFVSEEELLPMFQAVSRVYARLGEKKNRGRARIKFLVAKLGIEEFRRLVREERKVLPHDDRWTAYLKEVPAYREKPLKPASHLNGARHPEGFDDWARTNVNRQKQEGYAVASITVPLGDLTSFQARELGNICRRFVGDALRTTVEQNMVLRWVSEADLPAVYQELKKIGLGQAGAESIVDLTACPGTDTCKLGIASSRGLAGELRNRLLAKRGTLDESVQKLRIKISGCFNSCGQHHIADIGFYGNSRSVGSYKVPHFQVILGGKWVENGGSYGLAIGAIPSKRVPEFVDRITDRFVREKQPGETFQDFTIRIGKQELRGMLDDLMKVPSYEQDKSYFSDWGDPREFTVGDMGAGECAGEIVSLAQVELAAAEREVFEAQLEMDKSDFPIADERAFHSMLQAAKALIKMQFLDVREEPAEIVREFKTRFVETQLFHDRFAGGKFASYLFQRFEDPPAAFTKDSVRQLIEEAQLFIEAAYACHTRMTEKKPA